MSKYQPKEFEKKWQEEWKKDKTFTPNLDKAKSPYYALMMFPYPSAEGLHVGNMYAFTGADIFARYMRMQGNDVFEPIGLDGFGIHSENYAIKVNKHPLGLSKITEKRFYKQLMAIGNAFDWTRTVETFKPDYYKWTQWIFLQMYKNGLAYRKKAEVNWCPSCKTVLADEQVVNGKCERCGSEVLKRELEQWFFKITDYAERLLRNIEKLDWSEKVKVAQINWIGKKEGVNIDYPVKDTNEVITCFTTAPVNFGMTFIVIAPDHPLVKKILKGEIQVPPENKEQIKKYINEIKNKTAEQSLSETKEKTGVFTGLQAVNRIARWEVPVWISDFVVGEVGTGAVQGCPGHDYKDFEFAKKFGLPIIRVVVGPDNDLSPIEKSEQVIVKGTPGKMVNSKFLNGLDFEEGLQKTMDFAETKGWGKRIVTYHLRDWLISRQRYWGPPIPIIYCEKCGTVPVPEKDLPVILPYVENFRPTGTGVSPLASDKDFYEVTCPQCGKRARRETDVSDTFLDSAWYFFRYTSTEDKTKVWKQDRVKKWLPVNTYIGGAEHSVLHLLYSRFLTMVFKDIGLIQHFEEPFTRFMAHGLIISEGAKMSKSKGNVINPDTYIEEYGADTLRMYLMFLGPFDQGGDFRDQAISGPQNFLRRVWELQTRLNNFELNQEDNKWLNKTIKKVTDDIPSLKYNTAIAALMEWLNYLGRKKQISEKEYRILLLLLAPFAPHMTEEIWRNVIGEKKSIHLSSWPKVTVAVAEEEVNIPVQVDGKVRSVISVKRQALSDKKMIQNLALEDEKVKKYVEGKKYKVIYVERKILNFVITQADLGTC